MSLTYATFNCGNANQDRVTFDLLHLCELKPAVIGLNEAGDRKAELARVVRQTGYRLVRFDPSPTHRNSAKVVALVRPDVRVDFKYLVRLSKRTRVGFAVAGARRDGHAEDKYILAIGITADAEKRAVGVVHYVPSAMKRRNILARRLHRTQVRRTARWMKGRIRPVVVMGDMNADANDPKQRKMLAALARVATLRHAASHGRRHIDVFALRGVDGAVIALDGYSSDHKPVLLREK